ncbi:hypothetical protein A2572_01000 [Candidatus Collierbacteria bacterium RIFOXYD1_FULL_40_9]|uniref:Uncharacterized protein n=1 Tax=Candidatus Collierbacteria bacterium RIFOXYD1_FULL_40_9 TaxID=1817731 RepID=A0A1F5FVY1_9BACT|nr:MAG: hypothetical protein A2572_01000 [Candidatus Collierbacteria bacterium RIFOXYD1_FULL_40_9]
MGIRFGGGQGRSKGGVNSQINRRVNPIHYRNLGCNVAKESVTPKHSELLAETVGVILGDGGITNNQLKITLNSVLTWGMIAFYKIYFQNCLNFRLKSLREKERKLLIFLSLVLILCTH